MQIKTLQHCGLVVRDLERSRWFYGTVLGMQEIPRPSNFIFGGAWFQGGDSQLHLILASDTTAPAGFVDAGPARHSGLATHLAFEVEDLAAVPALCCAVMGLSNYTCMTPMATSSNVSIG
jgi:glyoxylase I family protein